MKSLVIFDTVSGNTEKIAKAIGEAISESGEAEVLSVGEVDPSKLSSVDFLVVGSPTHGGRPTADLKKIINSISENGLQEVSVAAFDTRIDAGDKGIGIRMVTGVLGYAAGRIGKNLRQKGGEQVGKPEGFIVEDREGPLKTGELKRAKEWVKDILDTMAR